MQLLHTESLFVSCLPDDFMLLLCASLQRQVFDDENKAAVRLMAGDNVEICRDLDAASFSVHNPVPDFIHCRCGGLCGNPIKNVTRLKRESRKELWFLICRCACVCTVISIPKKCDNQCTSSVKLLNSQYFQYK